MKNVNKFPFVMFVDRCAETSLWISRKMKVVGCPVKLLEEIPHTSVKGKFDPVTGITIYMRNIYKANASKEMNMFLFVKTMIHEYIHFLDGTIDRLTCDSTSIAIAELDCNLKVCKVFNSFNPNDWALHVGIDGDKATDLVDQFTFACLVNAYNYNKRYKTKYGLTISKEVNDAIDTLKKSVDLLSVNFLRNSSIKFTRASKITKSV